MKTSLLIFFLFVSLGCYAQSFEFAAKEAVRVPPEVAAKIRTYIEKHDGITLSPIGSQYPYVPVFNVLARSERKFVNGIYYFIRDYHDSGRLVINQNGSLTFLSNGDVSMTLNDYTAFIKKNKLPETTQIAYLSAIAAFMKYQYKNDQYLIKSGALQKVK